MKLAYKISLFVFLVSILSTDLQAFSKREFTKTIKKEFGITPDGTTSIYNKYGKVEIKTWDKDRVKVDVTILVDASSESSAQEVFDRITIDFSNGTGYVKAQTEIASKKSGWWDWSDNKSDYSINYEVFLPATNSVDLSNKYGDVYVAPIEGSADVAVKYGNFKLEKIGGNTNLNLGYGNGTIVSARDVTTEISYARLLFKSAKELDITSKYSKITIEKANDVRTVSKYDTYDIGEVREFKNNGKYDSFDIAYADNLVVTSKYSEVYTQKVGNSVDLDLEYGGATIEKIAKGFADVRIVGSYADFKIKVEDGASYRMEATANYAGIRYPEAMNVTYEKEKGTYHEVEGHTGTKGARSVIKAKLDYGGLKVRQD